MFRLALAQAAVALRVLQAQRCLVVIVDAEKSDRRQNLDAIEAIRRDGFALAELINVRSDCQIFVIEIDERRIQT